MSQMCAFFKVFGACLKLHTELEKAVLTTSALLQEHSFLKGIKCDTTTKRSQPGEMTLEVLRG